MSGNLDSSRQEERQPAVESQAKEVELSLKPAIDAVWASRRLMPVVALAVTAVFLAVAMALWAWTPFEATSTLRFRLLFPGAARGVYPNETPFSPEEILAAPVLSAVHEANDLGEYGTLGHFRNSLSVLATNPQLARLAADYQARIAKPGLTVQERTRLEDEFQAQVESLPAPSYALNLRRNERFRQMPAALTEKVLSDILKTWAEQTEDRKGVLGYAIPILSKSSLTLESLTASDYLVAADRLRAEANRVLHTLDEIGSIPGAVTMRTADGASYGEARTRLEDVLRYEIVPLIGRIRAEGITDDPSEFRNYASNLRFQLTLDKQLSAARAEALQQSLRNYVALNAPSSLDTSPSEPPGSAPEDPAVVPQIDTSFVDRIQEMAAITQRGELQYRRRIINQLIEERRAVAVIDRELSFYEGLAGMTSASRAPSPAQAMAIREAISQAFDVVSRATSDVHALYEEVSGRNLNPSAQMYAIDGAFVRRIDYAVSVRRLVMVYVAVIAVSLVTLPMLLVLRVAIRRWRGTQSASSAGA